MRPAVEEPGGPDVIEFATSEKHWLGYECPPAIRAILKAIYGYPAMTQEELDVFMVMSEGRPPKEGGYEEVTVIAGTRGGKTSRIGSVVMTYECLRWGPQIAGMLAPGEVAVGILIAADKKQAGTCRGYIQGNLEMLEEKGHKCLAEFTTGQQKAVTGTEIKLAWPIEIRIYPSNAYSVRSVTGLCFVGDEMAWWKSAEGDYNQDVKVMDAVESRFATLADIRPRRVKISSPNMKQGVMWDDYKARGTQPDVLVLKAPTWLLYPGVSQKYLDRQQERNPESFMRDFGAEFSDSTGEHMFLQASTIEQCVERGIKQRPPKPGVEYVAWMDAGFKRDRFSLAIGHEEREEGESKVAFDLSRHWTPPRKGKPLDDDELIDQTAAHLREYGIDRINADQFAEIPIKSKFEKRHGIRFVVTNATNAEKTDAYKNLRAALRAKLVKLLDDDIMIRDLKGLIQRPTPGGHTWIGAPSLRSAYDDAATVASRLVMKLLPLSSGFDLTELNARALSGSNANAGLDWRAHEEVPRDGFGIDGAFHGITQETVL